MAIKSEIQDGVTRIKLMRPPVNAFDGLMVEALREAFEVADPSLPIVLTGSGGKAFSAGVDTDFFAAASPQERGDMVRGITRMTGAILSHRSPVIAAINGHALGGGFVLMLCCDVRLAVNDPQIKLGIPEAKAGIPFPSGPREIIRETLPVDLLRKLALTGRSMSPAELLELGVIDALSGPADLAATAAMRAKALAIQPGFAAVKRQIRGPLAGQVRKLAEAAHEPYLKAFNAV